MDADQELPDDQLPQGFTPVWIEPPQGCSEVQILERVKEIIGEENTDVMVLICFSVEETCDWCRERGWQYHYAWNVTGCEAKCVVLLDCGLYPEYVTRGMNMLIIVSK